MISPHAKAPLSEGLFRVSGANLININSATTARLRGLRGVGTFYANRIVQGRPYETTLDLVVRGVMPHHVYDGLKDWIVASQP